MAALSASLRDEAIAIAKNNGDGVVETRHVLVALLRKKAVTEGTDSGSLPTEAQILGKRGNSVAPPTTSSEAEEMLGECTDVDSARAVLLRGIGDAQVGSTEATVQTSEGSGPATAAPTSTPPTPERSLAEALADLERLVGLESVKATINSLIEIHRLNTERADRSMPVVPVGLHLVFTGNPGTGKTTVARVVAEIYRALGLLPRGQLVEVQRADLVAGYVGHTAIQVQKVVQQARGGVLFIDEAYALAGTGDRDFGPEAIATLVKEMEDHRDDLAVIVAGYTNEMETFIASNSGLRSRFQRFIEFPDYADDELIDIFTRLAADHQITITPEVASAIRVFITDVPPEVRIGNGRFMRNLFEQMYARMAVRVAADGVFTEDELGAFDVTDVPVIEHLVTYEGWGFARGAVGEG